MSKIHSPIGRGEEWLNYSTGKDLEALVDFNWKEMKIWCGSPTVNVKRGAPCSRLPRAPVTSDEHLIPQWLPFNRNKLRWAAQHENKDWLRRGTRWRSPAPHEKTALDSRKRRCRCIMLLSLWPTRVTGNMEEVLGGFFHTLGGENHFMSSRRLPWLVFCAFTQRPLS